MASAKGADSTNRQLLGCCGVPATSAVPKAGNLDPKGPWKWLPQKERTLQNRQLLGGLPPFRRSQKPEIQQIRRGLGNGFRKRSGLYKIDNLWAFVGFLLRFGGPRSRKSSKSAVLLPSPAPCPACCIKTVEEIAKTLE